MGREGLARAVLKDRARVIPHVLMLLLVHVSAPAFAQADAKATAREHFAKGVAAFDQRRFAEAADEFETAYRLSPAFVVLYNIGQVDVMLGRSVEAVDAFDRYLKQGASSISAARRDEVQQEIDKQLTRIGRIVVRTSPEAAEVRLDGARVGVTPLDKPIRVSAGKHVVEAMLDGHLPQVRELEVAGLAQIEVELTLPSVSEPVAATPVVPAPLEAPAAAPPPAAVEPVHSDPPVIEKTFIERTYVEAPGTQVASRPSPPETSSGATVQRVVGYALIAGGLATTTVGGLMAYNGANQANDASARLASASTTAEWQQAKPDFDAGKRENEKGWAIAGIGAAISIGGVVVLATVPQKTSSLAFGGWVTGDRGGVIVRGAW